MDLVLTSILDLADTEITGAFSTDSYNRSGWCGDGTTSRRQPHSIPYTAPPD